jgi:membrane fusion protein (multidrug efflux system)
MPSRFRVRGPPLPAAGTDRVDAMVDTIQSEPMRRVARPGLLGWRPGRLAVRRLLVGGALLAVTAVAAHLGAGWWNVGRFVESTDDAYVGGEVTVIAPKVAGFIETVAVTDNQAVHAGDLLVRLDDRDYRASLARAEASVGGRGPSWSTWRRCGACRAS